MAWSILVSTYGSVFQAMRHAYHKPKSKKIHIISLMAWSILVSIYESVFQAGDTHTHTHTHTHAHTHTHIHIHIHMHMHTHTHTHHAHAHAPHTRTRTRTRTRTTRTRTRTRTHIHAWTELLVACHEKVQKTTIRILFPPQTKSRWQAQMASETAPLSLLEPHPLGEFGPCFSCMALIFPFFFLLASH